MNRIDRNTVPSSRKLSPVSNVFNKNILSNHSTLQVSII